MKNVLICWELGAGLGHLNPILQLSEQLLARGYKVWIASRELENIHHLFKHDNIHFMQAPVMPPPAAKQGVASCFAHLLEMVGYQDGDKLKNYLRAWQTLFQLIEPELTFFDHSPTALIASLPYSTRRIYLGSTFSCPPLAQPLGLYPRANKKEAMVIEKRVVALINKAGETLDMPPLKSLAHLFEYYQQQIFTTIAELDHFNGRPSSASSHFVSVSSFNAEQKPNWPKKGELKVFAYLKPGNYIVAVINYLIKNNCCAIIYLAGEANFKKGMPENIRIISHPLNMTAIAESADLVINNANLNSVLQLLKSSTPQLVAPLTLEQGMLADRLLENNQVGVLDTKNDISLAQQLMTLKKCAPLVIDDTTTEQKWQLALDSVLA